MMFYSDLILISFDRSYSRFVEPVGLINTSLIYTPTLPFAPALISEYGSDTFFCNTPAEDE